MNFQFNFTEKKNPIFRRLMFDMSQIEAYDPFTQYDFICCLMTQLRKANGKQILFDDEVADKVEELRLYFNEKSKATLNFTNNLLHRAILDYISQQTFNIVGDTEDALKMLTFYWDGRLEGRI